MKMVIKSTKKKLRMASSNINKSLFFKLLFYLFMQPYLFVIVCLLFTEILIDLELNKNNLRVQLNMIFFMIPYNKRYKQNSYAITSLSVYQYHLSRDRVDVSN